ncbi:uncharacterized protein LOC123292583 [Chrysoperla carnea]|uniref:uncharacterized protein LOC123292583 n=1 Tax=Chrysoperla carnea TaxID=189513 RepID=UPI001D079689|nr:uncharacterized protein LOC123292583 [Chrysoperla carnea]
MVKALEKSRRIGMNEPLLPVRKNRGNHLRRKIVLIINGCDLKSPLLWVPLTICVTISLIVSFFKIKSYSMYNTQLPQPSVTKSKYTIDQEGCRIPYLEEYSDSIKKYIFKPDPIDCVNNDHIVPEIITQTTDNKIFIDTRNHALVECWYESFWRVNPKPVNHDEQISVLILGLDSISRLNFRRQMPKTFNYLTNILDAKEMVGYNKIGDDTFTNTIAVLNGLTVDEIEQTCLNESKERRFDTCPLIWKIFNESGYITAYGEDTSHTGIFNYLRKGFFNPPTDFDYRVFNQLLEDEIGHTEKLGYKLCVGNDLKITKLFRYIKDFAITFKNQPYFGFFWSVSMSHDYLNYPNLIDDINYQLLKDLYESGALENTALFLISDHGMRYGGIRSTYQGFLEERLPMLYIFTPYWFRSKYPTAWANLITNTRRLTTPFDLHETLLDLKNLKFLQREKMRLKLYNKINNTATTSNGLSLFLPIPKERTCEMAAIPMHFCTCQIYQPLNVTSEIVVRNIANFVVNEINRLLIGYTSCAKLKLEKIISASINLVSGSNDDIFLKKTIPGYTVSLITTPGHGKFEASVSWNDGSPKLTGTISRTNLYRNQSRCISDFHLKLYCYCQSIF